MVSAGSQAPVRREAALRRTCRVRGESAAVRYGDAGRFGMAVYAEYLGPDEMRGLRGTALCGIV